MDTYKNTFQFSTFFKSILTTKLSDIKYRKLFEPQSEFFKQNLLL